MAELFQTSRTNVVEHIKHIYEEGESEEKPTCRKFRQVRKEENREVSRELPFYNAGSISHVQAIAKAAEEYQKYQIKNLSLVEEEYLYHVFFSIFTYIRERLFFLSFDDFS